MPALVFPAPGATSATQYLNPFSGFDIAPKSGGTFTNLVLYSQNFTATSTVTSVWTSTQATFSTDTVGTGTTVTLYTTSAWLGQLVSVTSGTVYTFSFYAKKGTITDLGYAISNSNTSSFLVSTSSYISSLSTTTWNRISTTFTATTSSVYLYPIRPIGSTGTTQIFGVQLEQGNTATSYQTTLGISYAALGVRPQSITYNYVNKLTSSRVLRSPNSTTLLSTLTGKVSLIQRPKSPVYLSAVGKVLPPKPIPIGINSYLNIVPKIGILKTSAAEVTSVDKVLRINPLNKISQPTTDLLRQLARITKFTTPATNISEPYRFTKYSDFVFFTDTRRELRSVASSINLTAKITKFTTPATKIALPVSLYTLPGRFKLSPYRVVNDITRSNLTTSTYIPKITSLSTTSVYMNLGRFIGGLPKLSGTENSVSFGAQFADISSVYQSLKDSIYDAENDIYTTSTYSLADVLKLTTLSPVGNYGIPTGPQLSVVGQNNIIFDSINYHTFDNDILTVGTYDYLSTLYFRYDFSQIASQPITFPTNSYVKITNSVTNFSQVVQVLASTVNSITVNAGSGFPIDYKGNTKIQSVTPFVYPQANVNLLGITFPYDFATPKENLFFTEKFTPNLRGNKYFIDRIMQDTPLTTNRGVMNTFQDSMIPGDFVKQVTGQSSGIRYRTVLDYIYDRDVLTYYINTQTVRTIYFLSDNVVPYPTGSQIRIKNNTVGFNQVYNVIAGTSNSVIIPLLSTSSNITSTLYTNTRIDLSVYGGPATFTDNRTDITELGSSTMTEVFNQGYPGYVNLDNWYYNIPFPFSPVFNGEIYSDVFLGTNSAIYFGAYDSYNWYDGTNSDSPDPSWVPDPTGPSNLSAPALYISSYNNTAYRIFVKTEGLIPTRKFRIRYEGYGYSYDSGDPTLVWEAVFYENPYAPGNGNGTIDVILIKDNRGSDGVTGASSGSSWLDLRDHRTAIPAGGVGTSVITGQPNFIGTTTFPVSSLYTIERVKASVYPQSNVRTITTATTPREVLFYAQMAPGYRGIYYDSQVSSRIIGPDRLVSTAGKVSSGLVVKGTSDNRSVNKIAIATKNVGVPDLRSTLRIENTYSQILVSTTVRPTNSREVLFYVQMAPGYRVNRSITYGNLFINDRAIINSGKVSAGATARQVSDIRVAGQLQKQLMQLRGDSAPRNYWDIDTLQKQLFVLRYDGVNSQYRLSGKLKFVTPLRSENNIFDIDFINRPFVIPANRTQVFFSPDSSYGREKKFVIPPLGQINLSKLSVAQVLRSDKTVFSSRDKLVFVTPLRTDRNLTFDVDLIQNPFRIPATKTQVFYAPTSSKVSSGLSVRGTDQRFTIDKLSQITRLKSDNLDLNYWNAEFLQKQILQIRADFVNYNAWIPPGNIAKYKMSALNSFLLYAPTSAKLSTGGVLRADRSSLTISFLPKPFVQIKGDNVNYLNSVPQLQKQLFQLRSDSVPKTYWDIDQLEKQLFKLTSDRNIFDIDFIDNPFRIPANRTQVFYTPYLGKTYSISPLKTVPYNLKIERMAPSIVLRQDSFRLTVDSLPKQIQYIREVPYRLSVSKLSSNAILRSDKALPLDVDRIEILKLPASRTEVFDAPLSSQLQKQLFQLRPDLSRNIYWDVEQLQKQLFVLKDLQNNIKTDSLSKQIQLIKDVPYRLSVSKLSSNAILRSDKALPLDVDRIEILKLPASRTQVFNIPNTYKLGSASVLRENITFRLSTDKLNVTTILKSDKLLTLDVDRIEILKLPASRTQIFYTPTVYKLTAATVVKDITAKITIDKLSVVSVVRSDNTAVLNIPQLQKQLFKLTSDRNIFDIDFINPFRISANRTQVFNTPTISQLPKQFITLKADTSRLIVSKLTNASVIKMADISNRFDRVLNLRKGFVVRAEPTYFWNTMIPFDKVKGSANNYQLFYLNPKNMGALNKQLFAYRDVSIRFITGKLVATTVAKDVSFDRLRVEKVTVITPLRTDRTNIRADKLEKYKLSAQNAQIFYTPTSAKLTASTVVRADTSKIAISKLNIATVLKSERQLHRSGILTDWQSQLNYSNITAPDSPRAWFQYFNIAPGFRYSHGIQQGRLASDVNAKINPDQLEFINGTGIGTDPITQLTTTSDPVLPVTGRSNQVTNNVIVWYLEDREVLTLLPIGSSVVTLDFLARDNIPLLPYPAGSTVRIEQANTGYVRNVTVVSATKGSITISDPGDLPSISSMTLRRLGSGYDVIVYFNPVYDLPSYPRLQPYRPGTFAKITNSVQKISETVQVTESGYNYVKFTKPTALRYFELADGGTISNASLSLFKKTDVFTNTAPTNARETLYYAELAQGYRHGIFLTPWGASLASFTYLQKPTTIEPRIATLMGLDYRRVKTDGAIIRLKTGDFKRGSRGIFDVAAPKKEPIQFWN